MRLDLCDSVFYFWGTFKMKNFIAYIFNTKNQIKILIILYGMGVGLEEPASVVIENIIINVKFFEIVRIYSA